MEIKPLAAMNFEGLDLMLLSFRMRKSEGSRQRGKRNKKLFLQRVPKNRQKSMDIALLSAAGLDRSSYAEV
ncbi:hypothetical protein TNCV_4144781 [Trichonephila clavipes]|nr:hypothetical protein TNCV_4144781 [Trichonephila clavipes]